MRKEYKSDLTDKEWERIKPYIPPPKRGGRPRKANMREVLNAIFYVVKTGCQWGMLPHDFPAKGTVYHYFNTWRKDGTWEAMNCQVREELRQRMGREATPSAAIMDSQSVKTTEKGGIAALTDTSE
jgi:putative transposase